MKKVISLVLSIAMLLSITAGLDFSAYAVTSEDFAYYLLDDGTDEIIDYKGSAIDLTIPSIIDGYTVTSIMRSSFEYCTSIISVTIPASVTKIGSRAFYECNNLIDINIHDNINYIGFWAFKDTAYYNNRSNWDNDVLYLENYLIEADNAILGQYAIKSGTTIIAEDAFNSSKYLSDVMIPKTVTTICMNAFCGCDSLINVRIPNNVIAIHAGAFSECENLKNVVFEKGINFIASCVFAYCNKLTSVTIPDSVTRIYNYAFDDCSSLTDVYYTGSEAKWNDISIGAYNDSLTNATIHYNSVISCSHTVVTDKAVAPTCTTTGLTEGKHCSVCNEVLVAQEVVDALGHNYASVVTAPTCTAKGYTTYTCKVCKYSYKGNYKNATGHKAVTDKAVAATCAKTGKTAGSHCSVCKTVIKKQSVVKAKGHSYDTGKVTTKPTDKKTGVLTYTCKNCKAKKTEKLAKLTNVSGVKVAGAKKSINVSWKKNTKMTGYEIQYSTNKNFKKAKTVKVTKNSTTKTTIKKLSSKKYYYVRVRTYKTINGTSCPASWSKAIKVKTK